MNQYLRVAAAIVSAVVLGPKAEEFVRSSFKETAADPTVSKAIHWGVPIGTGLGTYALTGMFFGGGK